MIEREASAVDAEGQADRHRDGREDDVPYEHGARPSAGGAVDLQLPERLDLGEAAEGEGRVPFFDGANEVAVVAPAQSPARSPISRP